MIVWVWTDGAFCLRLTPARTTSDLAGLQRFHFISPLRHWSIFYSYIFILRSVLLTYRQDNYVGSFWCIYILKTLLQWRKRKISWKDSLCRSTLSLIYFNCSGFLEDRYMISFSHIYPCIWMRWKAL